MNQDRDDALVEDCSFLFETNEHPTNMAKRLGVTNSYLSRLWTRRGDTARAFIFQQLAAEQK